jgi:putative sigma-54 modulation protein
LSEHHALGIADIEMNVNVIQTISNLDEINDQIEEENLQTIEKNLHPNHKVVSKEKYPLSQMNQNEAVMKLDLSGDYFMIFRSEEDRKLKIIYRREDGNYGIIEPE